MLPSVKPIENSNLKDWSCAKANQWADQAQREMINLCGELEMRHRLFQESRARNCREIVELRIICCEEVEPDN